MAYISNGERRAQFVDAATQVIRDYGIGAATTRRIADAAGAPLGSVHYCFRDKDELYELVMRSIGVQGMHRFADSVQPDMGVASAASAMFTASAKWALETFSDQLIEYEMYIWAVRSKKYAHIPTDMYQQWVQHVAALLDSARREDEPEYDLESLARMMLALIDGYILQDQFTGQKAISNQTQLAVTVLSRAIEAGDFTINKSRRRRARRSGGESE